FSAVLDRRTVSVLGIGAVFTQPNHRGHGYARDLVERLLEQATQRGAGAALLFSEIGADYYRPLGFEPIPTRELVVRVAEPLRRGAPAMLVRAGEDRDLDALAAIGRARAGPFRFHLDRDRALIQY